MFVSGITHSRNARLFLALNYETTCTNLLFFSLLTYNHIILSSLNIEISTAYSIYVKCCKYDSKRIISNRLGCFKIVDSVRLHKHFSPNGLDSDQICLQLD